MKLNELASDYYLLQFSNEELRDVIVKRDEWSETDVDLAEQVLRSRGQKVDRKELDEAHKAWLNDLRQPDKLHPLWVIAGYTFGIVGGLLGVLIGYSISHTKKTLPDGSKVYRYSEKDRGHGRVITLVGGILLAIGFLLRLLMVM